MLIVAGTALAALAGLCLTIARSHAFGGGASEAPPSKAHDAAAVVLALLATTGLALILGGLDISGAPLIAKTPPLVLGAIFGVHFFLFVGILKAPDILFRWTTRRPLQLNAPAFVLRNAAVSLVGFVAAGCVIVGLTALLPPGWSPLLIIPFAVALFPLYEHCVKPRLLFPRSFEIDAAGGPLADVVAWIRRTAERRRLGRVRVGLIPGDLINAYATGTGWSGRWILLGEGLVKCMTGAEIRWIAAHELAHVIRRDVPKLVVSAVVTGSLHLLILVTTVLPLYDGGRYFAASMLGGISGGLVLGVLPGVVSRRIELATDALGVRLAGDPHAACSALERLAEVTRRSPTQGSLTHPPVRRRVEAIRGQAG